MSLIYLVENTKIDTKLVLLKYGILSPANRPTPTVSNCPESLSNGNFASDGTHSRSTKTTRTKKVDGAKSTSSFKRTSSGSSKISPLLKTSSILTENGNFGANNSKPSKQRMGNDIR